MSARVHAGSPSVGRPEGVVLVDRNVRLGDLTDGDSDEDRFLWDDSAARQPVRHSFAKICLPLQRQHYHIAEIGKSDLFPCAQGSTMAKWGKFLLRNVLRHTDAHNKIQEEKEMWKMRGSQTQTPEVSTREAQRGNMHCDRVSDCPKSRPSEQDDQAARYWSRKLYEFEANDPDRWGHSGFKELYPEEFSSDSEGEDADHRTKKTKRELSVSKRSKKSKEKKKKKKKKKKEDEDEKEEEEGKRKKADVSSSSETQSARSKERRKSGKSKHHKGKRRRRSRSRRRDTGESSSQGMGEELDRERRTRCGKKRKHDANRDTDSGPDGARKKRGGGSGRKDWKEPAEGNSDDSSAD
ncbi:unnamed protein product [Boreogadus saida]